MTESHVLADHATNPDQQPHVEGPQGQDGTPENDQNNAGAVKKSLVDTLKELIPERSVLMRSIQKRVSSAVWMIDKDPRDDRISSAMETEPGGSQTNHCKSLQELENFIRTCSTVSGAVALIVEDIDLQWAQPILSRFPESVSPAFLAQHMVRLDSTATTDADIQKLQHDISMHCPGTDLVSRRLGNRYSRKLIDLAFPATTKSHTGEAHIDCSLSGTLIGDLSPPAFTLDRARQDVFEEVRPKVWRRVTTRISWCRLEENLHLVLVDANPDFNRKSRTWRYKPSEEDLFRILLGLPGKVHTEGSAKVPISYEPRSGPEADLFILEFLTYLWFFSNMIFATLELVGPTNAMELWFTSGSRSRRREPRFRISRIMSQLLQRHTIQSVFSPKTVPLSNSQEVVVGQIVTWLLAETSWHFATTDLENSLQRLRREATILPGSDVFPKLQKLRRQVADARILIAEARKLCVGPIWDASQWSVGGETVSAEGFWAQKPNAPNRAIYGRPQVMDIRRLSDSFDKFKKMIDEMTITITEEMQMVIGSVQVEDAKTMKRQTECTVVLAVLATIYLPMTLVTGIFGMNIQEINDDETRPDKWSTINTWALTFGATIGCIAVYAAGRWPVKWLMTKREKSRTRRQFLDLEAMKLE